LIRKESLRILGSCYEGLLLLLFLAYEHTLKLEDTLNALDLASKVCGFLGNTSRTWQSFTSLGKGLSPSFDQSIGDTTD